MMNCSQVKTLVRMTSPQMSFPEMVSDSWCRKSSVVQTHSFINCLGGWCQTISQGKKPGVEVLGWRGYTCSVVVRPVGNIFKFSKPTLFEKITLHSLATTLVDIPAVSITIARSLKTIRGIVL
jgi:hypothetical protein